MKNREEKKIIYVCVDPVSISPYTESVNKCMPRTKENPRISVYKKGEMRTVTSIKAQT